MVTVPADTVASNPDPGLITAINGSSLVHVPPGVELVNVVESFTHRFSIPPIGLGSGFTVITVVIEQPVVSKV
jgi:hypothetical protein